MPFVAKVGDVANGPLVKKKWCALKYWEPQHHCYCRLEPKAYFQLCSAASLIMKNNGLSEKHLLKMPDDVIMNMTMWDCINLVHSFFFSYQTKKLRLHFFHINA